MSKLNGLAGCHTPQREWYSREGRAQATKGSAAGHSTRFCPAVLPCGSALRFCPVVLPCGSVLLFCPAVLPHGGCSYRELRASHVPLSAQFTCRSDRDTDSADVTSGAGGCNEPLSVLTVPGQNPPSTPATLPQSSPSPRKQAEPRSPLLVLRRQT